MSTFSTYHDSEAEPTHALPKALVVKLIEAKRWRDDCVELEELIARVGGVAERNQEDRDDKLREGAVLLEEIVEIIDETWGFGLTL